MTLDKDKENHLRGAAGAELNKIKRRPFGTKILPTHAIKQTTSVKKKVRGKGEESANYKNRKKRTTEEKAGTWNDGAQEKPRKGPWRPVSQIEQINVLLRR